MASKRITEKDLDALCWRLNAITGSPTETYIGGKAQIGNYHISYEYGGACLHRICNEGGGVTTPIHAGHIPKRELYDSIYAYIRGIEDATVEYMKRSNVEGNRPPRTSGSQY